MRLFNFILDGYKVTVENEDLNDFFDQFCCGEFWLDCEITEQKKPLYSRLIGVFNTIAVWYDFGADYYFFQSNEA